MTLELSMVKVGIVEQDVQEERGPGSNQGQIEVEDIQILTCCEAIMLQGCTTQMVLNHHMYWDIQLLVNTTSQGHPSLSSPLSLT